MDQSFSSLASIHLPSPCRLLHSACCPDKDLLVLISRLGGRDRLSLWKIQGSKTWEVDVGAGDKGPGQIVGVAWSPDGQYIAVAHDPPRISLHSIQDGHEERSIYVPADHSNELVDIWWFPPEKGEPPKAIPDILKRNGIVPGSSHAILKTLPLLDSLQEESQKLPATDLFAFQGSQTRSEPKMAIPMLINRWPTLNSDPVVASIASPLKQTDPSNGQLDVVEEPNTGSLLAVSDSSGYVHFFLDGSYHLGAIFVGSVANIPALSKISTRPLFVSHSQISVNKDVQRTELLPRFIEMPTLEERHTRDMARLSTSARELVWYCMRAVKDMRTSWFGSDMLSGAREIGPKWIQALEKRQRDQFGQQEPNAVLDITGLLLTGRASDALADFLGSSEQMSERALQKWESSMTEALVKLRDFSEKRLAPALQRLHLVLEEVHGWSLLPRFASFQLSTPAIEACILQAGRAVFISSWLAAIARQELRRFREFLVWLRSEVATLNANNEIAQPLRHDILEVNNYLISGLIVSSIDKWFMGLLPTWSPADCGLAVGNQTLADAIEIARAAASHVGWQQTTTQRDLNHLDRNLDGLVQDLAVRCQQLFEVTAGTTSRFALVSCGRDSATSLATSSEPEIKVRERIKLGQNEEDGFEEYLAMHIPGASLHRSFLCLVHLRFARTASTTPVSAGVVLLGGIVPTELEEPLPINLEILDAEFFDDDLLVIVYRPRNMPERTVLATVGYSDLRFTSLSAEECDKIHAREDLMHWALERMQQGLLGTLAMPIKGQRDLALSRSGPVYLALNGRLGRRVACVLDAEGTSLETLDLEADGDQDEDE
ncbi:unnamed protein product [Mycena citricolor]|uniref:Anaphase-promoting complex subunit 4 n=1 Tax=Mycena citricolor TaxID=2018698 RepID=A0AAD2HR04_9AGAR|nr:unnamed protein product [Mycena citricolor]